MQKVPKCYLWAHLVFHFKFIETNNTGKSTSSKQMFLWRIQKNKVLDHGGILLSSLPVSASRTLVESRGWPSNSTCILKVEPGKLDIKSCEPGILFF